MEGAKCWKRITRLSQDQHEEETHAQTNDWRGHVQYHARVLNKIMDKDHKDIQYLMEPRVSAPTCKLHSLHVDTINTKLFSLSKENITPLIIQL